MVGNDAFGEQRLLTEISQKHNPNYEHVMWALLRHANQFRFAKRAGVAGLAVWLVVGVPTGPEQGLVATVLNRGWGS